MAVVIVNATLVEIREKDYAQKYEYYTEAGRTEYIWLAGLERAQDVNVGDKGSLIYRTDANYTLCSFEKHKGD